MRKLIKIIAAMTLLLGSTGAACDPQNQADNTPKDCFSDTGSDKPMFVDMVWQSGKRPFVAKGYARDNATGNKVEIDEIVTKREAFTRKLMYVSGCKVSIWMQVQNGKQTFAFVRADDGPGGAEATPKRGCRSEAQAVRSLACNFVTSR